MTMKNPRLIFTSLCALILIVYLAQAAGFWPLTVDDAYISARYADNAAHGRGLVFNPGERVMGYTNLLLVIIETLAYSMGADGLLAAKLLGLAAGASVLLLTVRISRSLGDGLYPWAGLLAAALLAVYPFLPLNATMGLETALFTALILGGIGLFIHCIQEKQWSWRQQAGMAALFFLGTLTRPEGLGFAAMALGFQLLLVLRDALPYGKSQAKKSWVSLKPLAWFGLYLVLLAPVLWGLSATYGSPIPNTFFAKTAAGFSLGKYTLGFLYLFQWFAQTGGGYWLVPVILLPFLARQSRKPLVLLAGFSGFYTLYILYSGGDWMSGFRFIVPAMPLYFLLAACGLVLIAQALGERLAYLTPLSRGLLSLILLIFLVSPAAASVLATQIDAAAQAIGYRQAHQYVGKWLRDNTPPGSRVAVMDIGMIAFTSDRYIVDINGLVNQDVARLMHADSGLISGSGPAAQKIAEVVLAGKPETIILASKKPDAKPTGWSHDEAVYASPAFQENYQFQFMRQFSDEYYLSVYMRNDR